MVGHEKSCPTVIDNILKGQKMLREIDDIDRWAMRQGEALDKQRCKSKLHKRHVRLQSEYNKQEFDKLFKETKA